MTGCEGRRTRRPWKAAILFAVLSAGCTRPSQPLTIHDPSKILYVEVTHWSEGGGRGPLEEHRIEDRKRIEAIIALLRSNNTGYRENTHWGILFGIVPSEEYTIHFTESVEGAAPLSVSFGSDWLSGIDELKNERGQEYFRTRPLSGSEREELIALIAPHPGDRDGL